MIMDDVSTMVSIKIAHGDLKFCSTHMMFQMMVKFDNILTLHTLWHYGVLRDMSKKGTETSCAEVGRYIGSTHTWHYELCQSMSNIINKQHN
jgi:hypothetical protein